MGYSRRFGFHGLSHAYCTERAATLLGQPAARLRLVTCHLGQGCSLAAVTAGRSVATTMGFTPLDGVMMGTRPGSLDPGLVTHLLGTGRLDLASLVDALNQDAGLKGISGLSGDMRQILAARAAGHERAALAFEMFVARLAEGIAAMTTAVGGLDSIVFAGGIGEHAAPVRAAVIERLRWMDVEIDETVNAEAQADRDVSSPASRVKVLVVHTREDLMIARDTARLTASGP